MKQEIKEKNVTNRKDKPQITSNDRTGERSVALRGGWRETD